MEIFADLSDVEFQQKLKETPGAVLLDVRTSGEYQSGRIPNAVNVDVMDSGFMNEIDGLDKTRTYFIYCRSGGRSAQACAVMSAKGFKVFNLAGGIMRWRGDVI